MRDAREELFWALWDNYTPEQKNGFINDHRDQVSHERAQELRAEAENLRRKFMTDAAVQFEKAADRIDPEVST